MKTERVTFPSEGETLVGNLLLPEGSGPFPLIVVCAGMSLTKEVWLPEYGAIFAENGYAVLHFDYRSFGESSGEPRRRLCPPWQVADTRAAIDALSRRPDVDPARIGLFGASLGCSVATAVAGEDPRVRAAVVVAGPADLTRVWSAFPGFPGFFAKVQAAREAYERDGTLTYIGVPRLLGGDPETAKKLQDEVGRFPNWQLDVTFESLLDLFAFQPERVAHQARALLVVQPDGDALIARTEAQSLYDRAVEPKGLLSLEGCRHVDIYGGGAAVSRIAAASLDWFATHLR